MQVLRILAALALALGVASASPVTVDASVTVGNLAGGNAACGSQRVRKPWSSLSVVEKSLYLEAAGLAIKNGVVSDLAAMHIESMGEAQAHHSCAFFTWHRRMLLAYEGYLRDLDPKFACVTIPYYDAHTAYVQAANKKCKSMYDCSDIFRDMGGEPSGEADMSLNGEPVSGFKVKSAVFASNCDDDAKCGYMVRNNLKQVRVPSGAGFASFQNIVTRSADYATFLEGIQFGLHNEIHNAVGGAMATFASPRDVFFFSWHGAIDMFVHVYHLCRIGVPLTEAELKKSLEAFSAATQKCGGVSGVGASTKVVQKMRVNGELVDVTEHPTLGKYFAHVGDEMWNYGDPRQLGDYSYSYELPEILTKQLLSNKDMCAGFNRVAEAPAPTPAPTVKATLKSTPTTPTKAATATQASKNATATEKPTLASADGSDSNDVPTVKPAQGYGGYGGRGNSSYGHSSGSDDDDDSAEDVGAGLSGGVAVSVGYDAYGKDLVNSLTTHSGIIVSDAVANATAGVVSDVGAVNVTSNANKTAVATTGDYWVWVKTTYDGLVERLEGNMELVAQQMQLIECQAFDTVFGVTEFSGEFVKNFHLASNRPLCGKKVDEIEAGNVTVAVAATEFKAETIEFADATVIQTVIDEFTPLTTSAQPLINPNYVHTAEAAIAAGADAAATSAPATASKHGSPTQSAGTEKRAKKQKICDF
ncbi:hypothetical protein PybrP1_011834 [[Pythium] brassicae (nom. inval.)]|nr:hypothetical protein PybrP1_011834 [[Pythium] brassicae (nom. inval.)]